MSEKQDQPTNTCSRTVNLPESLSRLGGDESLLLELIEIFLEDAPELLQSISEAIAQNDSHSYGSLAHRVKGLASNFSAHACSTAAWELEKRGRGQTECDPAELLENLRHETEAVRIELERYRESARS